MPMTEQCQDAEAMLVSVNMATCTATYTCSECGEHYTQLAPPDMCTTCTAQDMALHPHTQDKHCELWVLHQEACQGPPDGCDALAGETCKPYCEWYEPCPCNNWGANDGFAPDTIKAYQDMLATYNNSPDKTYGPPSFHTFIHG